MKVLALTGTPGTGKTTITEELAKFGWEVIELKALIEENDLGGEYDLERDTRAVDVEALSTVVVSRLEAIAGDMVVIEGHLAHELGLAPWILVLRCHPEVLARRLKERDYAMAKVRENCEAEALDVVLVEALEATKNHDPAGGKGGKVIENIKVAELDTSDLQPAAVARVIADWVAGATPEAIKAPGTARWLPRYLEVE